MAVAIVIKLAIVVSHVCVQLMLILFNIGPKVQCDIKESLGYKTKTNRKDTVVCHYLRHSAYTVSHGVSSEDKEDVPHGYTWQKQTRHKGDLTVVAVIPLGR